MFSVFFALVVAVSFREVRAIIPNSWIEYSAGTCNVIISSPHGGYTSPVEISDRVDGCLNTDGSCLWKKTCSPKSTSECPGKSSVDSKTQEISTLIVQALVNKGCTPHYVRSNLRRSKMDPNREIEEAAQGDVLAMEAWQRYHQYMKQAVEAVTADSGKGLVFDIHGQTHDELWTEIGNLISGSKLNSGSIDLSKSSLRALGARSTLSAAEIVQGSKSFGGLLASKGFKVVPSPEFPSPNTGGFFSGGYIINTYGSVNGGALDGQQMEITKDIRYYSDKHAAFAEAVAESIMEFRLQHGY